MEQLNGHEDMARLEPQNIGPLPRPQITGLSGREILDQLLNGARRRRISAQPCE